MPETDPARSSCVGLLDLEDLDVDLFRGRQPDSTAPRVYGGQVAAQSLIAGPRTVARRLPRALAALLLPAARRLPGADHLRRRADPRRPLVRDPAGDGAPARPADLLPDPQLPAGRGGLRPPGRDARGQAARGGPRHGRADAPRRQHRGRRPRQGVGRPRRALAGQLRARPRARPASTPRRRGCGSGSRATAGDDPLEHLAVFTYASDVILLGASLAAHDGQPDARRRWPRSTTPSGSTGRSGSTSGGSTTSGRPRPAARAGSPSAGSSSRTAPWSRPSPRRA